MRVLLAMDGSASSDTAQNLVASLQWPDATVIRVVAVVEPMSAALAGMSPYAAPEFDDRAIATSLDLRLTDAATRLAQPGRTIETRLLRGRPASAIIEEADDLRADLVVVGSRGLGRLRSMLLGSVSAEVVDHAPCPVLVARASSIGPVLVAVDGSDSARRAVEHLADAKYLQGHRLHVLSVGPLLSAGRPYWALDMTEPAARTVEDLVAEDRRRTEVHAARAADELKHDGYDVHWTIGAGDPAHEIIEAAEIFGCDLIAMGSRGLTGLDRVLLGSVARNVLLHSPASVLIVREPVRERQGTRCASTSVCRRLRPPADTMARHHGRPASPVTIRPIQGTDADALERFYAELSADSRATRFLGATPALGHASSQTFCTTDHEHREGFVAIVRDEGAPERIVGHLCIEPDGVGSAEIAVAVADPFQGRGIGRGLVQFAVAWGRRVGLRHLDATAFATNSRIIGLLRGLGLPVRIDWRGGSTCEVSIDLQALSSAA